MVPGNGRFIQLPLLLEQQLKALQHCQACITYLGLLQNGVDVLLRIASGGSRGRVANNNKHDQAHTTPRHHCNCFSGTESVVQRLGGICAMAFHVNFSRQISHACKQGFLQGMPA